MKQTNLLVLSFLVLFLLATTTAAQESCGICDMDGVVITGSITSLRELSDQMRTAEVPLRAYAEDSIFSIEAGSAHAVRDFTNWYRYRIDEQNKEEILNREIGELVKTALVHGLNFFLPGSGVVASRIRQYGVQAYSTILANTPNGTTDTAPYLERVRNNLETRNDRLNNLMIDMFNATSATPLFEQMAAVKREYVWEKAWMRDEVHPEASTATPSADTRRLLQELGVGPGGTTTSAQVRARVLTRLIGQVLCIEHRGNQFRSCDQHSWYFDALAKSQALRLILTGDPSRMGNLANNDHLNRVCPVEQTLGTGLLGMSNDCRRWRNR